MPCRRTSTPAGSRRSSGGWEAEPPSGPLPHGRGSFAAPHGRRGFTLLELVLVLFCLSLFMVLALPRLDGLRRRGNLGHQGEMAWTQAMRARALAQAGGWPVRLRIEPEARSVEVSVLGPEGAQDPADGLPATEVLATTQETLELSFDPADGVPRAAGSVDVVFLPDSRCADPGTLWLRSPAGSTRVVLEAGVRPPRWEDRP